MKPYSRLAWTNDEGGEGGSVTTVTFEEKGGKTLVILRERYPSKEALDAAGSGAADAMLESRRITAGQQLEIVARVALGGTPTASSGDPFGQVSYHVGKDGKLNIVIDRLAP